MELQPRGRPSRVTALSSWFLFWPGTNRGICVYLRAGKRRWNRTNKGRRLLADPDYQNSEYILPYAPEIENVIWYIHIPSCVRGFIQVGSASDLNYLMLQCYALTKYHINSVFWLSVVKWLYALAFALEFNRRTSFITGKTHVHKRSFCPTPAHVAPLDRPLQYQISNGRRP